MIAEEEVEMEVEEMVSSSMCPLRGGAAPQQYQCQATCGEPSYRNHLADLLWRLLRACRQRAAPAPCSGSARAAAA